ncbi:hypothetical protein CFP56_001387 [Quercus suber]|uniref:RBR-type E3 ubiquitin transferase n=1 Tax=Quercus suber TaxID=58331 RepID=A0AAW0LFX4_QUESU
MGFVICGGSVMRGLEIVDAELRGGDLVVQRWRLVVEEKCYCPDPQCSTLVLNECKIVTKSECPVCKKEFCFQCKTRWHAGYRCNESGQLRDENDVLLGRLIEEKKWSRCPNCGHAVERVDGCNDVICRVGIF